MKRKPLNRRSSDKIFRKGASNVKNRNFRVAPMRGGYRL